MKRLTRHCISQFLLYPSKSGCLFLVVLSSWVKGLQKNIKVELH